MLGKLIPLFYIFTMGYAAFSLTKAAFADSIQETLGNRFIALFVIVHIAGFFAFSNIFFIFVATIALIALSTRDPALSIATFLFMLPVLPSLDHSLDIGGLTIMWIGWPRLLLIVLLLPLFLSALRMRPIFHYPVDKYIWVYFLLMAALSFRDATFTAGLRSVIYLVLEVLVLYYVLSRHLRTHADVVRALLALLAALVFVGLINIFESVRYWHVYEEVIRSVTGRPGILTETRLGIMRAFGPLDRPSQSAFGLATGIGVLWALSPYARKRHIYIALLGILSLGLFFTFSRGSWIAAAIIGSGFLFTRNALQFVKVAIGLMIVAIPLSFLNITNQAVEILPFLGDESTDAARTVDYRQELFRASMTVAKENPIFGSTRFDHHPEMHAIRQASGFLDVVNHYMLLLLTTGYAGLATFVSIFLSTLLLLYRALRKSENVSSEERTVCSAVFYTLCGLLVAISATSALSRVGLILFCLVAIAMTSTDILKSAHVPRRTSPKSSSRLSESQDHG